MVAGKVGSEFEELCCEASRFKNLVFSEATKTTYRCELNAYLRFCIYFERVPCPADQTTLKCYIAFLSRSLKPSSLPGYLNVVHILHVNSGFKNPLENNFEVGLIKRGVSRALGSPPVQKRPITLDLLRLILHSLDMSHAADVAFWAACLTCFFGLLRKGTLLPESRMEVSRCVLRSDVTICADSFVLQVRHTKTVQFGERVLVILYVACADLDLCPVRSLLLHLTLSPLDPKNPLFNYVLGGRVFGFTHSSFVDKLRSIIRSLGSDSTRYSGHSFRRGGCTLCFQAGLSIIEIKRRGDWRSNVFERYIHVPSESIYRSACVLSAYSAMKN
jgi:hypothetical protein